MKLLIFLILILNSFADTSYFENAQIGNLSALDSKLILQLNSTTKGSFFAPAMTTAEKLAIPLPIITGTTVFDTTLQKYSLWNGTFWEILGGSTLNNWVTATIYKIGDTVVYPPESNDIFRALTDHTSAATFNADRLAGAW